jgi:hypothetical protein
MYTPGLAMAVTCIPCDRQIMQISSPDTVCHFALSFQSACNCCKCPQKKSTNAVADKEELYWVLPCFCQNPGKYPTLDSAVAFWLVSRINRFNWMIYEATTRRYPPNKPVVPIISRQHAECGRLEAELHIAWYLHLQFSYYSLRFKI